MRTNSGSQSNNQLDLVTPVAELLQDLVKFLFKGLVMLIRFIYEKHFLKNPPLRKIEGQALFCKKKTDNPQALGIDCSNRSEVLLKDINFKKHTFIVGASGFGKTNLLSLFQEESLARNRPIIFFDPKGDREAMETFKNLCEKNGKVCHIFSEWYGESIKLNPVLEGTVNQVADRIMRAFVWSEQYYKDYSYRLLLKVLNDLRGENEEFSLKKIYDVLIDRYDSKEATGLIVKLESIIKSDFGHLLEGTKKDFTLSKIRDSKTCLYIGLSTQGYAETAMSIGKLFLEELLFNSYSTLKLESSEETGINNPIAVYFDEFGAVVTPQFVELLNKCRGAGIELTMAIQTNADIDRLNLSLTKQIIENCGNIFVMKQRLDEAASFFSNAIGTIIEKKKTFALDGDDYSGRGTEREANAYIVHANIIKNLKTGQGVFLRHDPSQVQLINFRLRHKEEVTKETENQVKAINTKGAF